MQNLPPELLQALQSIYGGMDEFADTENKGDMLARYGGQGGPPGAPPPGEQPEAGAGPAADIEEVPGAIGDDALPGAEGEMAPEGMDAMGGLPGGEELDPELLQALMALAGQQGG